MGGEGDIDTIAPVSDPVPRENGFNTDNGMSAASSSSTAAVKANSEAEEAQDHLSNEKSNKKDESNGTVPFHKLFSFADSKDLVLMIVGTVGALGNGLMLPLMTVIFGDLIQSFGGTTDIHDVVHQVSKTFGVHTINWFWLAIISFTLGHNAFSLCDHLSWGNVSLKFVYLAAGAGVASFLEVSCWMATGERQAARIRNLYLKTILRQEVGFFDRETNTGEVVERMSGDTVLIQDAMGEKVGKFIQLIATFLGGTIIAFVQGWRLALVLLAVFPPLVVAGGIVATVVTKMASLGQAAYAEAANLVEQSIGSIRTVASFAGEKLSVSMYDGFLKKAYKSSVHEGVATGLGLGTVMFIVFAGYGFGIWYGSELIFHNGYTGAKVINVIFALMAGSLSLGQASPCMKAFAQGRAAAFKMFEAINRKPLIDAYDAEGKILDEVRGDIELRDVYFIYPARPNEQIFAGFSLFIQSGTTVALVGESGSGKSTVVSLIERFYDPQAGEVLIDGINLKELQLRWIRGVIGLVSQEPVLFASSIRDNIAYGKDGATTEEIRAAAELANASKFIDKMPRGIDTMVGEHGTQLSGGQKQRITIARAIVKDPRILLLDEATSALDVESERIVQEALDRVMTNRTTVIVAHRLTTVRDADTIAVLHRGKIVEQGSHHDLLKDQDGAYCQLVRLQEKKQDSDQTSQSDHDELNASIESPRKSSHHKSLNRSISRRSSLVNSGRHSFTLSFGLPVAVDGAVDGVERTLEEANANLAPHERKEVPLSRLASLNKPEIPVLILGAIAAVINGLIVPIFGVLLSSVINTYYQPPPKLRKDSRLWAIMYVVFGLVSLVALPTSSYFFSIAGAKLIRRVRLMTFEKVINMEIGWFDDPENSSGAIGGRLAADAATVRTLVGDALALLVQNSATLVSGLLFAFIANWQLSLIILAMVPVFALDGYIQLKFMKGFSADAKMKYEEASQVVTDAVGSIRTVASFSAEAKVMKLYKRKCEGPMRTGIRQGIISGVGFGASSFLLYCVYALCFYAGARLVQDGKTTFGKVFRVFFALSMAAVGLSDTSSLSSNASKAKAAAASVFAILDRKSEIDPSDESGFTLERLKGDVEFQHVSFKYPTRPDVQIFHDFCLTVHSGKTVALVGESGSGKSTAVALLQRFYNPDSGHILIDGIEIEKFQLRWLRQKMGLVSQEPVLFNDTIRANIAYGKEGKATEAEITAAAELANAHKFISSLQQGYDTLVGERGIQLSGGQKQRVAIARAIVKEPKILLLDEATSALDAESERMVQDALDRMMVNRTTMVIAHRLSTVKNADLIVVVKNGVIVEKGKHDSLINIKDGAYASLATLHSRSST